MNGQYVGITPIANLRVPEGDHELRMEPEGLPASTIRVTVTAGETQRIVRRLYP